jgi:hypothetical protein
MDWIYDLYEGSSMNEQKNRIVYSVDLFPILLYP